jgi:hypothetical protein
MTLLLTADGQVAGAVEPSGSSGRGNALAVVDKDGKVRMLCGNTELELHVTAAEEYRGHVVQIFSSRKDEVQFAVKKGGVSADLDVTTGKLGKADLAQNAVILAAGKRVFACAGGDKHAQPGVGALTTIYSEALASASFLPHLRAGDFTCGPVGIRMCVGDTKSGGQCAFEGKKLTVCVSDFHESVKFADHSYRLDILTDEGVVFSAPVSCEEETFVTLNAESCAFYRAEILDTTRDLRIAIGNPIWNR